MSRQSFFALGILAIFTIGIACGDDDSDGQIGPPSPTASSATATIVGEDLAFDRTFIGVAAGEEVTLTFDHRDDLVLHNLHVLAGSAGDFKTEIEPGPVTQALVFTIDEPGEYIYVCDVHPAQMRGTIVVQ